MSILIIKFPIDSFRMLVFFDLQKLRLLRLLRLPYSFYPKMRSNAFYNCHSISYNFFISRIEIIVYFVLILIDSFYKISANINDIPSSSSPSFTSKNLFEFLLIPCFSSIFQIYFQRQFVNTQHRRCLLKSRTKLPLKNPTAKLAVNATRRFKLYNH
jgi:hypothetical protein